MFKLEEMKFDISCPECQAKNKIKFCQAKNEDVILCVKCKIKIQLNDKGGELKRIESEIKDSLKQIEKSIKNINLK